MNKQQGIAWFKNIQQGGGTYAERTEFPKQFGAGSIAVAAWDDGVFTLGLEYGILLALSTVLGLQKADLTEQG